MVEKKDIQNMLLSLPHARSHSVIFKLQNYFVQICHLKMDLQWHASTRKYCIVYLMIIVTVWISVKQAKHCNNIDIFTSV